MFRIEGEVVEAGMLEPDDGSAHGFVIRQRERFITVRGLTPDEVRSMFPLYTDGAYIEAAVKRA